jgi:hypothetical protein
MARLRWAGVLAAAGVIAIAGCGSVHATRGAGSASPAASTPARSVSKSSPLPEAGPTANTTVGRVPAGFAATSVTWVSPDEAFVLGTAPCAHAPCTGQGYTGHTSKRVYVSHDDGAHWTLAGQPSPYGDAGSCC